jgi:hypothetical protein
MVSAVALSHDNDQQLFTEMNNNDSINISSVLNFTYEEVKNAAFDYATEGVALTALAALGITLNAMALYIMQKGPSPKNRLSAGML